MTLLLIQNLQILKFRNVFRRSSDVVLKAPLVILCFAHYRSVFEMIIVARKAILPSLNSTQNSGESPHNSGDLLGCGSCLSNLKVTILGKLSKLRRHTI